MALFNNRSGNAPETTPFVYILGWPDLHRFYIGVRYAKRCNPTDMWTRYFTSCDKVHKLAVEHGPPPYLDILVCESSDAAKALEESLLRDNKVQRLDHFLNQHVSGAVNMTPEVRAKVSTARRAYFANPDNRKVMSVATHKRYANPAERHKTSEGAKRRYDDPLERAKQSERMKEVHRKRREARN